MLLLCGAESESGEGERVYEVSRHQLTQHHISHFTQEFYADKMKAKVKRVHF